MKRLYQFSKKMPKQVWIVLFIVCTLSLLASQEVEEIVTEEVKERTSERKEKEDPKDTRKPERRSFSANLETDLTLTALYPWGGVLEAGETIDVALLRFTSPLTSMNGLKFRGSIKVTPITLEADFKTTFTPIAFLQFFGGAGIGSGWSFSKFHGFAKNVDDGTGKSRIIPINMKDFFFSTRFGMTLQFDLGAILKNDWTHVLFLSDQGFKYFGAGNMTSRDSWVYAQDYGESRNSWIYASRYILGYQMPIPLSFVGLQVELEKKLYTDPPNKQQWGDDLMYAYITPIIAFTATRYLNIVVATQFFTRKNYEHSVDTFYENNFVKRSVPQYIEFYRLAISCVFTFKH